MDAEELTTHNRKTELTEVSSKHHPSCTEADKSLVWHCSQCGLNEPADEDLFRRAAIIESDWQEQSAMFAQTVTEIKRNARAEVESETRRANAAEVQRASLRKTVRELRGKLAKRESK